MNIPMIRNILNALLACVLFLIFTLATSWLVSSALHLLGIQDLAIRLSLSSILSGGLVMVYFSCFHHPTVRWKRALDTALLHGLWPIKIVFSSLLIIFALNLFSEWLALPDNNIQAMDAMVHHPLGVLALVIMAPLTEELVFREVMIGGVLDACKLNPWVPVLVSSLAFGLVHANPAQIPFASAMGLLFGYLYCKTGSIVLGVVLHVINNGVAVLLMLLFGPDASLSKVFHDDWCLLIFSFMGLALGVGSIIWLTNQKNSKPSRA